MSGDTLKRVAIECDDSFVQSIADLGVASRSPGFVTCPVTQRSIFVGSDGGVVESYSRYPERVDQAETLSGFADLALAMYSAAAEKNAMALVSNTVAEVVFDWGGERLARLSLDLGLCDSASALIRGIGLTKQKELVRMLRDQFDGNFDPSESLTAFRTLSFKVTAEAGADVQHGRESVKGNVEQSVSGAGDIPERITLRTPWFEVFAEEEDPPLFEVVCSVEVDFDAGAFRVSPLDGQVARARAMAMEALATRLRDRFAGSGLPVVCGASLG